MNWTEEFIGQCLEGVPEGGYRTRTEKELEDHLLALCRNLEEAGYAPEEARALAAARMGDPGELSRRYIREWRRRTLWPRLLAAAELTLFAACVAVVSLLYIANAQNFGKPHPAFWGIVAIITDQFLWWSLYGLFAKHWTPVGPACLVLAVIQLPPILCWMASSGPFEFTGVMMVPNWLGLMVHVLFLAWSVGNYKLFTRFQQEDNLIQHAQSA